MQELDLKQYPLAASPTPASLKNIHFEIGGKQTIFREAEDTTLALEQVCDPVYKRNEYSLTGGIIVARRTTNPSKCQGGSPDRGDI